MAGDEVRMVGDMVECELGIISKCERDIHNFLSLFLFPSLSLVAAATVTSAVPVFPHSSPEAPTYVANVPSLPKMSWSELNWNA